METIWYTEPSGNQIPNPTADQMLAFMRQEYDGYWGPYSPVGVLRWYRHPPQPEPTLIGMSADAEISRLVFVHHPERGWFFEFSSDVPCRWLVSLEPEGDRQKWIKHWTCGEETCFMAACFVPQAVG